jgi:hypothetical protein
MRHVRSWVIPIASFLGALLLTALTGSARPPRLLARIPAAPTAEECKTTLQELSVKRTNFHDFKAVVTARLTVTPNKASGTHTLKLSFYNSDESLREAKTLTFPDATANGEFKLRKEIDMPEGSFGIKLEYSFKCDPNGTPSTGVATDGIVKNPPDVTAPKPAPLLLSSSLTPKFSDQEANYDFKLKALNNVGAVTAQIIITVEFVFENAGDNFTETLALVNTDSIGVFTIKNNLHAPALTIGINVTAKTLAVDSEGNQGFDMKMKSAP